MQKEEPESDTPASAGSDDTTQWILEGAHRVVIGPEPDQVTVYANGVATAVLEKHVNTRDLACVDPVFKARVYDFEVLYWLHSGAMLRLQGEHTLDILGLSICVLRGEHRPIWHPRPGMNGVRVVVPIDNPEGLRPIEVFQLASRLGF